MLTQPLEMTLARRQWHKHFVAQLGSRLLQHPGADMEDHWEEMVYYRNRYAELRQSWARERTAVALAEAQAEVTRLRSELEECEQSLSSIRFQTVMQLTSMRVSPKWGDIATTHSIDDIISHLECVRDRLGGAKSQTRAALETTPTGEATNGNG